MVTDLKEHIFEDIIETIREPLLVLDSNLKVIFASRSFFNFFKVRREETLGSVIFDLGNKQWNIPKLRELLETILPEKTTFDNYEVEHDFTTIGKRTMLLNARQIEQTMGEERIILLAIEDITERKRLDDLLTDSEERYRRLFETANDGILLFEKSELKISQANPAVTAMLGYSNEDCIGKKMKDIGFPDDIGIFQEVMQTLNKDGIIHYKDFQVKKKNGQIIDTDIYMVDKASLVQCNIRDITDRKRAEKEIREKEKLQGIVEIAGTVCHELSQPMHIISGYIEVLAMNGSEDDPKYKKLKKIKGQVERMATLLQKLNEITRYETKAHDSKTKIIDLEKSTE